MEIAIAWGVFAVLAGFFAVRRGRSGFGYFLLSLILSPLIVAILLAVLPINQDQIDRDDLAEGKKKRCPHCAEIVLPGAKTCRYCGGVIEA